MALANPLPSCGRKGASAETMGSVRQAIARVRHVRPTANAWERVPCLVCVAEEVVPASRVVRTATAGRRT